METVITERTFPTPVTRKDLRANVKHAGCFAVHQVRPVQSFLALDGRRMICVFQAPDAESVRIANRKSQLPFDVAWTGRVAGPGGRAGLQHVLVERTFPDPVRFEAVQALEDRAAWCLDQHGVRFLYSYFSMDQKRMLCVYEAPDAESVRISNRVAGLPTDAVWAAHLLQTRTLFR